MQESNRIMVLTMVFDQANSSLAFYGDMPLEIASGLVQQLIVEQKLQERMKLMETENAAN